MDPTPFNNKQTLLQIFSSKKKWDDARIHCQNSEAELASVTSSETNNFLTTLTQKKCWIGGYTEDKDTWQWTDGSPWGYTNWRIDRPNNKGGNQDKLWFYLISCLFTILMIILCKVQMAAVSVVPSILDFLSDEVILP